MNKKTLIALLCGVLAAALICIAVGLIIYIPALNISIDKAAADYAALSQQKSSLMALGMLIMIVGCSGVIIPALALIVIMIINVVSAANNKL